jgi:hypothetical protein
LKDSRKPEEPPIDNHSVIIRSYFNYAYYTSQHPQTVDNYFSCVQLLQTIDSVIMIRTLVVMRTTMIS